MKALLSEAKKILPDLLQDESGWEGLFIDYHKPFVERLKYKWGDNRIFLHRIFPCEPKEALYHPHPWPSEVEIFSGSYEMGIGVWDGDPTSKPPVAAKLFLSAGSSYQMFDPNGWHYVAPLGEPSVSLMVTRPLWKANFTEPQRVFRKLTPEERKALFGFFKERFA